MPYRKRHHLPGSGRVNAAIDAIVRTTKTGVNAAHATRAHHKAIAEIDTFEERNGAHSACR